MEDQHRSSLRILQEVQSAALFIIAAVALGFASYWLADVLIPLVLALFLAISARPLTHLLRNKLKVPHGFAVVLTFAIGFVVLFLIGLILASAFNSISERADHYNERFSHVRDEIVNSLPLETMGMDAEEVNDKIASATDGLSENVASAAVSVLGTLLGQGSMVMLYLIFLMLGATVRAPPSDGDDEGISAQIAHQIE
ncbi:MAG: AI-2E family transporter, partial [Planctomycetes bacterium]|nr:AI-2E family transporter [Planctomycetota bacterium]